jgi:hypothetical protein
MRRMVNDRAAAAVHPVLAGRPEPCVLPPAVCRPGPCSDSVSAKKETVDRTYAPLYS